jgi:CDP-diacylglycerol--glycerol-3-phosphate 3-phosphatidyltransferase
MPDSLRRRLPNLVTVARLVLAIAFFVILSLPVTAGSTFWGNLAVALFIVAALSDILDGYLARRWETTSAFGRVMDPFCDKVLVIGAFIILAGPRFAEMTETGEPLQVSGVAVWMVLVVLGRELLVTSIRGVVEASGGTFAATWPGKAKMLLQSVTVPLCLFVAINVGPRVVDADEWRYLRDGLLWATVIVTAWSALPYIARGRQALAEAARG